MRFCAVLDSDRDVYYDAAPKPRMGRYPAACVSRAWISAVLLLNKPTSQGIWCVGRVFQKENPYLTKCRYGFCLLILCGNYALSTRPDFRHDVHTYIFFDPPSVFTLTDFTFDFHIFGVFLWEWLTLFPKWAPFSQIAHFAMITPPNALTSPQIEDSQH